MYQRAQRNWPVTSSCQLKGYKREERFKRRAVAKTVCVADLRRSSKASWINRRFSLMASRRALRQLERRNLASQLSPCGTLSPQDQGGIPLPSTWITISAPRSCISLVKSSPRLVYAKRCSKAEEQDEEAEHLHIPGPHLHDQQPWIICIRLQSLTQSELSFLRHYPQALFFSSCSKRIREFQALLYSFMHLKCAPFV